LALDEPKEEDVEIEVDDFTFVVEDVLAENFNVFTIDYSNSWLRRGFTVIPDGRISTC